MKTKHIFPAFSFYDRTGIQKYLEKKARQGWLLEKTEGFTWRFRAIEPRRLHFAVTYFPKASAFDPEPSEQQRMFQEFCAHSGWQLAAASAQMQIFYNEAEDPVPIETDPLIELENIHKTAKKSYLPIYFMLLPLGLIQWLPLGMQWQYDPISVLASGISMFNVLCSIVLLLLCGTELIGYFTWYRRAKKAALEDGSFVATKGRRAFQIVLAIIMLACLVGLLFTLADPRMSVMMVLILLMIAAVSAVGIGAMKLMKRKKFSAAMNSFVTFALIIVLSIAIGGIGTMKIMAHMMANWPEETEVKTYEWNGTIRTLHQDDIPLKIQDMQEADPEIYSYQWFEQHESLLLGKFEAHQMPRYDMLDQPELSYTIVDVKADFLYDFSLEAMLDTGDEPNSYDEVGNAYFEEYCQADAAPWGAQAAYELYYGTDFHNEYVLCFENRIVHMEPDWEMTPEQKAIVGQTLG